MGIVSHYRDTIRSQAAVPPELLAAVLLAELRHYNPIDAIQDMFGTGRGYSLGITQTSATTVQRLGLLPGWGTDRIEGALLNDRAAIGILALTLDRYYQKWRRDEQQLATPDSLAEFWNQANDGNREKIVAGMLVAKDDLRDRFNMNNIASGYALEYGPSSLRMVRQFSLLK